MSRQVRALERLLKGLAIRGLVEQHGNVPPRYRLKGWECLHTKRRATRLARQRGGRDGFALVRHSA